MYQSKIRYDIEEVVNEKNFVFKENVSKTYKAEDYSYVIKYDLEQINTKKASFLVSQMERNMASACFYKLFMLKAGGRKDYNVPFAYKLHMFMEAKIKNNVESAWLTIYNYVYKQKLNELDQNACELVKDTRSLKSALDEEFETFSSQYSFFKIRNQIFKNKKERYKTIWNKVIKRNREKLDAKKMI